METNADDRETGRPRRRAGGAALVTTLLIAPVLWLVLAPRLPAAEPATDTAASPPSRAPATAPAATQPASRPTSPRVRVGLPEALERRAGLTPAHPRAVCAG